MVPRFAVSSETSLDRPLPASRWWLSLGVIGMVSACNAILSFDEGQLGQPATGGQGGVEGPMGGRGTAGDADHGGFAGIGGTGQGLSGGGGAGLTGGTGQGGSGVEDCTNGVDDDGDLDADCADVDCASTHSCTPVVPGGWTGFFSIFAQAYSFPGPVIAACPDGAAALRLYAGPRAASCSPCGCNVTQAPTCGVTQVYCEEEGTGTSNCSGTLVNSTGEFDHVNCFYHSATEHSAPTSCALGAEVVVSDGSCASTGGGLIPTPMWSSLVDVCATSLAGAGCLTGQCVSNDYVCIARDGSHSCPSGWAGGASAITYASGTDGRGCASCGCNSTTPEGECRDEYRVYNRTSQDCSPPATTALKANNQCGNVGLSAADGRWAVRRDEAQPTGACDATGGTPTGAVTGQGQRTYCCF